MPKITSSDIKIRRQLNNQGVDEAEAKNPTKAAKLFQQAAEMGDELAMCNLADAYEKGLGIERNFNKAAHWYFQAAKLNSKTPYGLLTVSSYAVHQLLCLANGTYHVPTAAHNLAM
jgi:TPR repeat protein